MKFFISGVNDPTEKIIEVNSLEELKDIGVKAKHPLILDFSEKYGLGHRIKIYDDYIE